MESGENWELRAAQVARIAGTTDSARLDDVVRAARYHVRQQRRARADGERTPWVHAGPTNVPGRIGALAFDPSGPGTLYAGSAAGGVFESVAGAAWTPLWLAEQDSLAIGGLAAGAGVIYAATGEWEGDANPANKYHHFPGVGIYVRRDGDPAWRLKPIPSRWTSAVAIDPINRDRVFVAGDAGLHTSTNGGDIWHTIAGLPAAPISDVVLDPDEPDRLYVGVHLDGVWRSLDGGSRWSRLDVGGPGLVSPRIALGRHGAHRTRFAAVLARGHVFASENGGDTWMERGRLKGIESNHEVTDEPGYAAWCTAVAVDPTDEAVLFAGHIRLWRSADGGRHWTIVSRTGFPVEGRGHDDIQALVFDPADSRHVWVATDGGVFESNDGGSTWHAKNDGLCTTQCYTVAVGTSPYRRAITTQDNRCYQAEGTDDFRIVLDRLEGGWVDYDPGDSRTVYLDTRNTQAPWPMRRLTLGPSGEPVSVQAFTDDTGAPLESDATIREALAIARTRPAWLLVVTSDGRLLGSTDGGAHWTQVLNPGANETICAVEYSPTDEHHAYCTTGRGEVWHSSGGGGVRTWTRLPRGPLPTRPVNDIEVDPANPLRVYLAFGANDITFGEDVTALWVGDVDAADGALWSPISGRSPALSLPPRLPITGIAIDPTPPGAIYVSHLLGIHVSTDGGASWTPFDEGLPNCFVADLDFHAPTRTLHVATMGRGLYRRPLPGRP